MSQVPEPDTDLTITLSAYDTPVTVTAPPADQTTDAPLFGGAFGG